MPTNNFIEKTNLSLKVESVKYKKIETKNEDKYKTVKSIVTDSYKILGIKDTEIEIEYIRKVDFKPKVLFSATIVISIVLGLNKDRDEEANHDLIMHELDDRSGEFLVIAASNASMMISAISSVSLPFPLITPPFYMEDGDQD